MSPQSKRPRAFAALSAGLFGHPLHPPLTDVTIGAFVLGTALGVIGSLGGLGPTAGKSMCVLLASGLIAAVPTLTTGLMDWLRIDWGTEAWRTATAHMGAMVVSILFFGIALLLQWPGWRNGEVTRWGLGLSLVGLGLLIAGGWLGGALVFRHGLRQVGARSADAPQVVADPRSAEPGSPRSDA